MSLFDGRLFQKERFYKIRKLLLDAGRGIRFHGKTFELAMEKMIGLTEDRGFTNIIEFMQSLDLLSQTQQRPNSTSEGFTPQALTSESTRIQQVYSAF